MFKTLGIVVASVNGLEDIIQILLDLQQESFPEQKIEWEEVFDNLGERRVYSTSFGFLVKCSISKRVNAIGLKHYRDAIMKKLKGTYMEALSEYGRTVFHNDVKRMIKQYETEYQNLKEATSVLELVLWKNRMSDDGRESRKRKFDETDRNQCRISCGADIVIQHVLPYLLPG